MKKRQDIGQCVYCLRENVDITKDHIFSRKWYPASTPPTIEKWVVPACSPCNHRYGVIEQELMIRMGLCLDPQSPESFGIPQKALRAIDPKLGKNERDRRARQKLKERILKDTFPTETPLTQGVLPNFGLQEGMNYDGKYTAIKIPAEQLDQLGRKFVRGLTYKLENGLLITPDQTIEIYHAEDSKVSEVIAIIERAGYTEYRGPGVRIQQAVGDLDWVGALFRITLWERWTIYAVIWPSNSEARNQE